MPLDPTKIFVHKASTNAPQFGHMKQAFPKAQVVVVSTNTRLNDPSYGLISIDPKKRGLQKRQFIGMMHRNAQWKLDPNGRSTDFLPSNMLGYGCRFMCTYCYVDRRDPATFPKLYDDSMRVVDLIKATMSDQANARAFFKKVVPGKDLERYRDPKHGSFITFDLGCDSDCTIDNELTAHANYPGHIIDIINQIAEVPEAMISFATKSANIDPFIKHIKTPSMCRIRLSLMPEHHRQILELNTSKILDRLNAINKLVDCGFEVHINLSPIVVTRDFKNEYASLLSLIDSTLTDKAKNQLAYEIIFLTHAPTIYNKVSEYGPKAQNIMVGGPCTLVPKWNKPNVVSYSRGDKDALKATMRALINKSTPYARIRYMF